MKTFFLTPLINEFETNISPLVDPNCHDIELARECENFCIDDLAKCITECKNDTGCTAECYRTEIDCIDSCPCHTDCPQGNDFICVLSGAILYHAKVN